MTLLLRLAFITLMAASLATGGGWLGAGWIVGAVLALAGAGLAQWLYHQGVTRPLRVAGSRIAALEQRNALAQAFMDNAPVVIAAKDKEGRYLTANAEFERMHRIGNDQLRGKLDGELDIMPSETARTVRANDLRVLESGETLTYQVPMQSPRGWRQMETIKFPLYGANRQVIGVGLVAADVTEREVTNEKFARVFHASPNWIVITRLADGVIIDANEGFEHSSGHSRQAAIGQPVKTLNIWVNPQQRADIIERLLRDGRVTDAKVQMRRRDNEIRDFVANAALISLEGQINSHAVWIARDVTEEQAVHGQFVAAFRLSPDFMSISRAKDGRYVEVNAAFERFTGYRRDEVIGKTSVEIGLWHDPAERVTLIAALERDTEVRDFHVHLCNRNGLVREGVGYAAVFETRGERYMIAMMRDVTDAHLAERALRESEARFANLFELSPIPTSYSFDTDNYTTHYRNAAFEATFGYPRNDAAGRSVGELGFWVHPQDAMRARQMRLDALPVDNWVVELRHADGRHLWAAIFGRVIVEPQRTILVTTVFDITEQRHTQNQVEELNVRLEDRVRERTAQLQAANAELSLALQTLEQARDRLVQSEKLASLGSLVAGVAHELNTPIGNGLTVASALDERVRVFADAARRPMQRSTMEQFITETQLAADLLVRSLGRAATLVASFKQVAVDQTSSQRRSFDLANLLAEVLITIGPAIRHAHCEVVAEVPDGLSLDSFPGPLVQVLTNLINNALVHGFAPGQSGRIRVGAVTTNPGQIEVSVRDNGKGIAPTHIKRIFDPFFTTRLGQGGSGLGLHVVHNIVTGILGGRVEVQSAVGEGCQFVLHLPVVAPLPVDLTSVHDATP